MQVQKIYQTKIRRILHHVQNQQILGKEERRKFYTTHKVMQTKFSKIQKSYLKF